MSKSTLSILTSIFLGTAVAAPAAAGAQARYPFLNHFLSALHLEKEKRSKGPSGPHKARTGDVNDELTVYDVPGAAATSGVGINAAGFVAGEFVGSDDHTHGFLRAPDGSFTIINVDANPTSGFWLNDKGAVTGDYLEAGIVQAYVRQPNGAIAKIEPPDSQHADGLDINNEGVATGDYVDSNGLWHGFIRSKDGTLTTFEEPNAGTGADQGTFAGATNLRGDTIGPYVDENFILHGYIRHPDRTYTEFDVAGALDTVPFYVSTTGWVVGFSDDATGAMHGFLRGPKGNIIAVDAPDAGKGPGQGTIVQGVNNGGIATGNYIDASDVSHGFLRLKDGTIKEFDAPGAGPGGTTPVSINSDGVISGSMFDENGVMHGVIGTP